MPIWVLLRQLKNKQRNNDPFEVFYYIVPTVKKHAAQLKTNITDNLIVVTYDNHSLSY